jgi:RNA polymerase sigma-70 factor (ECF subfamily)
VTAVVLRQALAAAGPDLLAYLERRVVVREDAADLLAETFLQAWRRVEDLPEEAERQRMWLFATAGHVLANHRRSHRRRRALAERLRGHLAATGDAPPDDAEASAVRDAVRRLPEEQRELVMLVHWDGFTLAAAAELLGLNASTARGRYAAARAALRVALGEPPPGASAAPVAAVDQLREVPALPRAR